MPAKKSTLGNIAGTVKSIYNDPFGWGLIKSAIVFGVAVVVARSLASNPEVTGINFKMQQPSVGFSMPMSARSAGYSAFGASFSQSKHPTNLEFKQGLNIVTNLPLQMAIYFNAFYFPFWFLSFMISFITKIQALEQVYQVTVGACLVTMTLVEIPRLYFGFSGNLKEGISQLAGFWLLTLLIQLPLVSFLLFTPEAKSLPFESANHIVFFVFVVGEAFFGLYTIMLMVREQTNRFRIRYLIHDMPEPVHYKDEEGDEDELAEDAQ